MPCPSTRPAPLRCPDVPELLAQVLALLPRGRAWQSNEGGPARGFEPAFQADFVQGDAFQSGRREGSVLYRFWRAVAAMLAFLYARACDLRREFFCATQRETYDLWLAEYGLPDPCDPFPDLCAKVAALGGTRCPYFADIAARFGWTIDCLDWAHACGAEVGCAEVGCCEPGGARGTGMTIVVHVDESPVLVTAPRQDPPEAGCFEVGQPLNCYAPEQYDFTPLRCIMERIVPAHLSIEYVPA